MKDVFISYKAEEFDEANSVKSILETNGISCWMAPACIPGGSSYAEEIPKAIRQAKVFVLVLSDKAQKSRWVSREVDLAINEGKIVLPFMLENCKLKDDFNFYLTNVQRYAAYENKVAAVEKMIREIKSVIGSGAAPDGDSDISIPNVMPSFEKTDSQQTSAKKDKALWSMILGIISVMSIGLLFVPNILAIVFSVKGIKDIRQRGYGAKGYAVTGFVLGNMGMAIALFGLAGVIGVFISVAVVLISLIFFIGAYEGNMEKTK